MPKVSPSLQTGAIYIHPCTGYDHGFFYECSFLNLKEVTALCQNLYFPAEAYTVATFITAHVVLYYLCRDLDESALEQLHLSAAEARDMVDTCSHNVETASRSLRILMDPTYDNIQALTMAVSLTAIIALYCPMLTTRPSVIACDRDVTILRSLEFCVCSLSNVSICWVSPAPSLLGRPKSRNFAKAPKFLVLVGQRPCVVSELWARS